MRTSLLCLVVLLLEVVRAVAEATAVPSAVSVDLATWREPHGEWLEAGEATSDPANAKALFATPGDGVLLNGKTGRTSDLLSVAEFGDVELHLEFMVPQGSNSGVYFQGRYEIQILDSWGVKELHHGDCGGIYQRWKLDPGISDAERGFEGKAPRANASKQPGEWQSFDIIFRAPRFDTAGKKTENARFVKVVHNGVIIHENEDVTGPTRAARFEDEQPMGPLMLQGDHGPVAFRNIRIKLLELETAK
ncbi:MAG: DUF1080 domain-containing protein [Candidatus Hydrogenedentes bacterium]|nr:DUF1080 domain-containing protein [Candidatus Hydrogenedentota bacterium]